MQISDLSKNEMILCGVLIIYLLIGVPTPTIVDTISTSFIGQIILSALSIYLFIKCNIVVAILFLGVLFIIMYKEDQFGLAALNKYSPSEEKKQGQLNVYNQFPYTLEEEVVAKMAPIVRSNFSLTPTTYKPVIGNLHDAQVLSS